MAEPFILPASIRLAARPGESVHQDFVIAPVAGTLTAMVIVFAGDRSVCRLRELVALDQVKVRLTDDEFNALPPQLRNEAHRFSVTFVEAGRAGAGVPLAVRRGQRVSGVVDCAAPAGAQPSIHKAVLVVSGVGPHPTEVPIEFVIG